MENVLLEIYEKACGGNHFSLMSEFGDGKSMSDAFRIREEVCRKYSFAVPNDPALTMLLKYSPIVELGCGSGYWAALANSMGCDVVAIDVNPPAKDKDENTWFKHVPTFFPVIEGDETLLANYPNHTLFLCWPPYGDSMAYKALLHFRGNRVIYIGEGNGGCTANDDFHEYLEENFENVSSVAIPQWFAIHDYMTVWELK